MQNLISDLMPYEMFDAFWNDVVCAGLASVVEIWCRPCTHTVFLITSDDKISSRYAYLKGKKKNQLTITRCVDYEIY